MIDVSSVHCALDNYILNDWCCYPVIFKHHWELSEFRCHSIQWMMCLLSFYICVHSIFSTITCEKHTNNGRQISSSIIILYHMCVSNVVKDYTFGMESVSIENDKYYSTPGHWWCCYLVYRLLNILS